MTIYNRNAEFTARLQEARALLDAALAAQGIGSERAQVLSDFDTVMQSSTRSLVPLSMLSAVIEAAKRLYAILGQMQEFAAFPEVFALLVFKAQDMEFNLRQPNGNSNYVPRIFNGPIAFTANGMVDGALSLPANQVNLATPGVSDPTHHFLDSIVTVLRSPKATQNVVPAANYKEDPYAKIEAVLEGTPLKEALTPDMLKGVADKLLKSLIEEGFVPRKQDVTKNLPTAEG